MKEDILVCPNCGSENMEWKCWVKVNTNSVGDSAVFGIEDCWCPNCETHQLPINKEEYVKNTY